MNRMFLVSLLGVIIVAPSTATAQGTRDAALPQFDVASIKQNTQGDPLSNNWRVLPERTDYHNSQIIELVKSAQGDFSRRVEGAPRWISADRYDVIVQYPLGTPGETRQLMLRQLLNEPLA